MQFTTSGADDEGSQILRAFSRPVRPSLDSTAEQEFLPEER